MLVGCANINQLHDILQLLNHLKLRNNDQSPQAVELNWMISLLLKSLYIILQQVRGYYGNHIYHNLQNSDNKGGEIIKAILDANILPIVVRWASLPTQMSQKWLLLDLEVSCLLNYLDHGSCDFCRCSVFTCINHMLKMMLPWKQKQKGCHSNQ